MTDVRVSMSEAQGALVMPDHEREICRSTDA
jgi:hypothetical protein